MKKFNNIIFFFQRKHANILHAEQDTAKYVKTDVNVKSFFAKTQQTSKYQSNDQRQIKFTDASIHFVAGDLLPLSIVDSTNFRTFVEKGQVGNISAQKFYTRRGRIFF